MARLTFPTLLVVLLAQLGVASAFMCPTASQDPDASCFCTSGCSIDGDAVDFEWSAPVYPPEAIPMGADTICATFVLPCTTAATSMLAFLGASGNIQMDNDATCVAARARWGAPRGRRVCCTRSLTRATRCPSPTHSNDVELCSPGTQVVFHTAFTAEECALAETDFDALLAAMPSVDHVHPVMCTASDCNSVGSIGDTTVHSSAVRAGAAGALALALTAALL